MNATTTTSIPNIGFGIFYNDTSYDISNNDTSYDIFNNDTCSDNNNSNSSGLTHTQPISSHVSGPCLSTNESSSQEVVLLFQTRVLYTILHISIIELLSMFGVAGNVVNMIVYFRLGVLWENSNVTLFSLALVDCVCLLQQLWVGISLAIAVYIDQSAASFDPWAVYRVTGYRPKMVLTQISCWITAFLPFQHCIGERVFTIKRSVLAISIIVVAILVSYIPIYTVEYLGWQDERVQVVGSLFNNKMVDMVAMIANMFVFRFATIIITVVCNIEIRRQMLKAYENGLKSSKPSTGIELKIPYHMAISLTLEELERTLCKSELSSWQSNRQCRKAAWDQPLSEDDLEKEGKLVKMIAVISAIFVACYTPEIVIVCLTEILDVIQGETADAALVGVQFLSEVVKSSVNILVFYYMSGGYKKVLRSILGVDRVKVIVV